MGKSHRYIEMPLSDSRCEMMKAWPMILVEGMRSGGIQIEQTGSADGELDMVCEK